MVAAMWGAVRSLRPCFVMLMALALTLGAYGFDGAIHSVHHLLSSDAVYPHDAHDSEDEHSAGGAGSEQDCHVAAAASHAAATAGETAPIITPAPADSRMLLLATAEAPRLAWVKPDRGRAPPSSRLLSS